MPSLGRRVSCLGSCEHGEPFSPTPDGDPAPAQAMPQTALPSSPLVAFYIAFVAGTLHLLRTSDLRLEEATLAMVGGSELVSPTALAVVRGCFAALGLCTLRSSIADKEGVRYQLQRPAGSQLPVVQVHLTGLKRLTTFTVQSWTLLSLYFTGATVASAAFACGAALPQLVQVGLWLSFETAWASALMTSSVTTCVCTPDPQGP
jgi:hypothetical protein